MSLFIKIEMENLHPTGLRIYLMEKGPIVSPSKIGPRKTWYIV